MKGRGPVSPANYDARVAKALEGIERHNKDLVKVMEALNNNFALFARIIKDAMEPLEEEGLCKHAQVDKCSGCGNEYCEVLGCNPNISALPCGCSPNYCCCGPNDVKTEVSDGSQ